MTIFATLTACEHLETLPATAWQPATHICLLPSGERGYITFTQDQAICKSLKNRVFEGGDYVVCAGPESAPEFATVKLPQYLLGQPRTN